MLALEFAISSLAEGNGSLGVMMSPGELLKHVALVF